MSLDRIVTLRLSESDYAKAKEIAAQNGEGVTALLRGWITDRLFADCSLPLRVGSGSATSSAELVKMQVLS